MTPENLERFALETARLGDASAAIARVSPRSTRAAEAAAAARAMRDPAVRQRVRTYASWLLHRSGLDPDDVGASALHSLIDISEDADAPSAARVSAADRLLRAIGAGPEGEAPAGEPRAVLLGPAELRELIGELVAAAGPAPIEGMEPRARPLYTVGGAPLTIDPVLPTVTKITKYDSVADVVGED